jgi:hypothetical protein
MHNSCQRACHSKADGENKVMGKEFFFVGGDGEGKKK